jgi:hypothetical protein
MDMIGLLSLELGALTTGSLEDPVTDDSAGLCSPLPSSCACMKEIGDKGSSASDATIGFKFMTILYFNFLIEDKLFVKKNFF